jgi:hypothetical protein
LEQVMAQNILERRKRGLETYLQEYRYSTRVPEVERYLAGVREELADKELRRILELGDVPRRNALVTFLAKGPIARLAEAASAALEAVNASIEASTFRRALDQTDEERRSEDLRDYMTTYPDGSHYQEARAMLISLTAGRDQTFFERALESDSPAKQRRLLIRYIEIFPGGDFIEEASALLEELEHPR